VLARDAPRPRVAPIIRMVGMVVVWGCRIGSLEGFEIVREGLGRELKGMEY